MAIKYYYIDDDPLPTTEETAKGLSIDPKVLMVTAFLHKEWNDEIEFLKQNQNNFDGILLDWNLRKNKNENNENANYDAETLAQQIRLLITKEGGFTKDFPIVLCSADSKFNDIFAKELTGHDLFDWCYSKYDFDAEHTRVIKELHSLGAGYKVLNQHRKEVLTIFGIENESEIDFRIKNHVETKFNIKDSPPHIYARFILKELLSISGPLINDTVLAARLGVDINNNIEDWEKLKNEILADCKYTGVFHEGWERWWMSRITNWWKTEFPNSEALDFLSAMERIDLINEKLDLHLISAEKTPFSRSLDFWTVCKYSHKPLSIDDGILLNERKYRLPWQEDEYISIDTALGGSVDKNNIDPLEIDRLQKLKRIHTRERKRR